MGHIKTSAGIKGVRFVVYVNGVEHDRQNIPYEDIAAGTKDFVSRLIKNGVFWVEDYTDIYTRIFSWGIPGYAVKSYYKSIYKGYRGYRDDAKRIEIKAIAFAWKGRAN